MNESNDQSPDPSREEVLDLLKTERELTAVGRAANSTLALPDLFHQIATSLGRMIPFDRMSISLLQPNGETERAFALGIGAHDIGFDSIEFESDTPVPRRPDGSILLSGDSQHLPPYGILQILGLKAWAEVQINSAIGIVGYLSIFSTNTDAYTKVEINKLNRVAELIAPAIVNARLYQQTRQELRFRTVLATLGHIITSTTEVDETYEKIAIEISKVIPTDRLVITSLTDSTRLRTASYVWGTSIQSQEQGSSNPVPPDLAEIIYKDKTPTIVDSEFTTKHPSVVPFWDLGLHAGLHSWMVAPIIWRSNVIGALHFRHAEPDVYNDEHIQYAELIADQLAAAIASSTTTK